MLFKYCKLRTKIVKHNPNFPIYKLNNYTFLMLLFSFCTFIPLFVHKTTKVGNTKEKRSLEKVGCKKMTVRNQ